MNAQTSAPPAPPPAPPAPPPAIAGQVAPVGSGAGTGLVRLEDLLGRQPTAADIKAIQERASSLSNQLLSAQGRREEVVKELGRTSDPAVRAGLEQRLKVLDDRLASLEGEIAVNSRLNAATRGSLAGTVQDSRPSMSPIDGLSQGGFIAITIVFTIFVLAPIATAFARRLWTKPAPVAPNSQLAAQGERIERMEHAIDAVAIEVERISEGQRFVTQLLAKQREGTAIGSGQHVDA